jgi:hypothetical protein
MNSIRISLSDSKSSGILSKKSKILKNNRLAKQFLLMNICEIGSCLMLIGLGTRYLFKNLNEYYNVIRISLKISNLFFQLLIPIVSMKYCPFIKPVLTKWKKKFNKKTEKFVRLRKNNNNIFY